MVDQISEPSQIDHALNSIKKVARILTGDDTWGQERSSDFCGAENKELGHEVEPGDTEGAEDNVVHARSNERRTKRRCLDGRSLLNLNSRRSCSLVERW